MNQDRGSVSAVFFAALFCGGMVWLHQWVTTEYSMDDMARYGTLAVMVLSGFSLVVKTLKLLFRMVFGSWG